MSDYPQRSEGHPKRYVIYLNMTWPYAMGIFTGSDCQVVFDACWNIVRKTAVPGLPLGLFRLTTIDPTMPDPQYAPKFGLRDGEYVECKFGPATAPYGGAYTGISPLRIDRNPDLLYPNVCRVAVGTAPPPSFVKAQDLKLYGQCAAHEAMGHTALPSWGAMGDMTVHNSDPNNFLYSGGAIADDPTVYDTQVKGLQYNLDRVRGAGVRLLPTGVGEVTDHGRPANWLFQ